MRKQDASPPPEQSVSFGFQNVSEAEKPRLVRGVFDAVAARYDIMNDLMSLGLHRTWKATLINDLRPQASMTLLDLAGGTGDIAFRAIERAPEMKVAICDINAAMLSEGRTRSFERNSFQQARFICGDAEALPFPDRHFDACTIAFGIRNVTHIDRALAEIHRVLKPGGRFFCLEFCPTPHGVPKSIYDFYSFQLIPRIGKWVAGDDTPYRYLAESIRRFPQPQTFARMITSAGFTNTKWRALGGGIVAIHNGWRV